MGSNFGSGKSTDWAVLPEPSQSSDMGSITCKCNRLQLQLLLHFMITDYNYNYFFLNVIDYNYRLHCKVIMITL